MSSATRAIRVDVSGPTRVRVADHEVPLSPRQRAVVAALALDRPRPVSVARLVELLWPGGPPPTAHQSVLNQVSRIRTRVPGLLERDGTGYHFARGVHVDDGSSHVARPDVDPDVLQDAFADLDDHPDVADRRHRLLDTALIVRAAECERLLDADPVQAATLAADLVRRAPFHEGHWWVLALAEARLGRRRDALAVLDRARTTLADVGLEPGERLRALERAVLDDAVERAPLRPPDGPTVSTDLVDPSVTDRPIGIDEIVDRLARHLDDGIAHTTVFSGPAGAGKSIALATVAAAARERGVATFVVGCDPEAAVPLQPIADLVRLIAERHPAAFEAVEDRAALAALAPDRASVRGGVVDRRRVLDAVSDLLRHLPGSSLVAVEDVHWAPPRTAEAVLRLSQLASAPSEGLVVAVTVRDDDPDLLDRFEQAGATVERLPRWGTAEIDTYLVPVEGDPVRRAAGARWLEVETGGLPMFVRELALHLVRSGAIGPLATGGFEAPDDVPAEISTALAARVSRLGHDAARTLEAAAILGPTTRLATLRRFPTARDVGIQDLVARGMLLLDGDTLRFDHELLRRVVLDRLGPAAVVELHDLALTALDPSASVMELARHAVAASDLDLERAVHLASGAGTEALRRSARESAAAWWLDAAALLAGLPDRRADRWRLRIAAGEQLLHAGDPRARDLLFDVVREAEGAGDLTVAAAAATVVCRLGPTSEAGVVDTDAAATCDRLISRIDAPGPRALLRAAATMVHSLAGRSTYCRELLDQAIEDARLADDDEVWAHVLPYAYQTLPLPTDVSRRDELADRLLEVADRLERADARWAGLHLRFANRMMLGDPTARDLAAQVRDVTAHVREQSRDWEFHYLRAALAHLDGDLDGSERIITDSLSYADTVAASRVMAVYGVQLLALRMDQGRLGELVDAIAGLCESQPAVGAWRAAHAFASAHAEQPDQAMASFDLAIADDAACLDRDQTFVAATVALAETAVALEDPVRSRRVLELLEPFAGTWSWTGSCTLGPVDTSLAGLHHVLGDLHAARAAAASAIDSTRRMRAPTFERHALARRDRLDAVHG